jgi:hypothetical protein
MRANDFNEQDIVPERELSGTRHEVLAQIDELMLG